MDESSFSQKAILIVPKGTGGAKYSSVREANKDNISVIEINQKEAEKMISKAKTDPSEKGQEIARIIFPELEEKAEESSE